MTPTLFSVLPVCRIRIKSGDPLQLLKFQVMKMTMPHPLLKQNSSSFFKICGFKLLTVCFYPLTCTGLLVRPQIVRPLLLLRGPTYMCSILYPWSFLYLFVAMCLLASPQMKAPLLAFVCVLLNRRLKLNLSFLWMMYLFSKKVPLLLLRPLQSMEFFAFNLVLVTDLFI